MKPFVSVIVPVYKVEKYLPRCLDSLCRQSLQNIEILLIDDASPDHCGTICEAYAVKDKRFKVFHHSENKGLSAARNLGIRQATADYLMFVDSDDWVHEDFCKIPYDCAVQNHADLVMFHYERIAYPNASNHKKNVGTRMTSGYKSRLEAMDLLLQTEVGQTAWNKLYRKELFKNISYPTGYLYEDVGTTYKTIWQASQIYYLDKILYFQCYRKGSITTLRTKKALQDWIEMILQQYHDLAAWSYPSDKLADLLKRKALTYCIKKKADYSDKYYVFCANVILQCKTIPDNYTWKQKLLFILFKHCRSLFEFICILSGRKYC